MFKKVLSGILVLVTTAGLLTGCGSGQGGEKITLVEGGASEYVIVCGEEATPAEMNAVVELQTYLAKITGVSIEIVTDAAAEKEKEIIVGKTNREGKREFNRKKLTEDGFVIKTADSKLWLVGGGDRGTLYSVYEFLEAYLDCGFYTKSVEVVPQKDEITVAIEEDMQIPTFAMRGIRTPGSGDTQYSVKRRYNLELAGRNLKEEHGDGISYCKGVGGHTYDVWVSGNQYFGTHPEYFGMDEHGNRLATYQPCLTNPDVIELLIEGAKDWLDTYPESQVVSVSQLDHNNYCHCDKCKEVYEENGGALSSTVLMAANAVADAIKEDYPYAKVQTFIYMYSRSAPTKIKPAENVLVDFCTMGGCFAHAIEEACEIKTSYHSNIDGTHNSLLKDLQDWSKICKDGQLKIYDYGSNFAYPITTFPDFSHIREDIQLFAEAGAVAVEMECALNTHKSPELQELRAYLVSKLLWDAEMSEEEYYAHMDEFLEAVYGKGGKYVKEYIEVAEASIKGETGQPKGCLGLVAPLNDTYMLTTEQKHGANELPEDLTVDMIKNYTSTDWSKYWNWYTDAKGEEIYTKGPELFAKAKELAETEEQTKELAAISSQVRFLESCYRYQQIEVGGLDQLISKVIEKNAGAFTAEEKNKLPKTIADYAKEQMKKEYEEDNRAFCEEMVRLGIIGITSTVTLNNWQSFDFSLPPNEWG